MEVGSSVATLVLKMIGLIEKLEKLGFMLHHQLSVDLILQSLPPSFSNFVMNFKLTQVETSTLPELLNMLKTAEDSIRKEKGYVLMVDVTPPPPTSGRCAGHSTEIPSCYL